ncbi:MAG: hypothetical protein Q7T05_07595 [Dehalococcoidia bacterium]|nr:hypothetical protein [Dehalococcoidia bacterium]
MPINADRHRKNQMLKNATFEQRVKWHGEHAVAWGCRPLPEKLAAVMKKRGFSS